MTIDWIDPLQEPQWDAWAAQFPHAGPFHSSHWARVLAETYRFERLYGVLRDGERPAALLPLMDVSSAVTGRRGVALPFSDECPMLWTDSEQGRALWDAAARLARERRWKYLELRGETPAGATAVPSAAFMVHDLTLEQDPEALWRRLKDANRRNVQKARKAGVQIHRLATPEAMDIYYRLHCLTRRRHGLPPQSKAFFRAVQRCVIARGQGFIGLAQWEGRWIAGAVYLHFGRQAVYKFGASDLAYQHLRANNLLMWEAIAFYAAAGFERFSFGRTDPANEGLLQFKRGWGAQESSRRYYRIGPGARASAPSIEADTGHGWSSRIMTRLPIPVLRWIGTVLYRHVG